jgi:urease accessory protein
MVDARSEPPLAVRRTADRILLVGSAAAPVGGDQIDIDIVVGPGATAAIGSVAATSIFPGPAGDRSHLSTNVALGCDARLTWWPEPMVSIADSDHRSSTRVHLAPSAALTLVEEVSLGRSCQPSGTLELDLRVERDGIVLVHHCERFGPCEPGAGSAVGVGGARHVVSGVVVGAEVGPAVTSLDADGSGAWLPVTDDAAMILVVAADRPAAMRVLGKLRPCLASR